MDMFPVIPGSENEEYNSLRESVQASMILFQKFKSELQEMNESPIPVGDTHAAATELMQQSQCLCLQWWWSVICSDQSWWEYNKWNYPNECKSTYREAIVSFFVRDIWWLSEKKETTVNPCVCSSTVDLVSGLWLNAPNGRVRFLLNAKEKRDWMRSIEWMICQRQKRMK